MEARIFSVAEANQVQVSAVSDSYVEAAILPMKASDDGYAEARAA